MNNSENRKGTKPMRKMKISLRAAMEDDNAFEPWALEAVADAVDQTRAMQAEWGMPCDDHDAECPACQAWDAFRLKIGASKIRG
jgi:hypothetical protein